MSKHDSFIQVPTNLFMFLNHGDLLYENSSETGFSFKHIGLYCFLLAHANPLKTMDKHGNGYMQGFITEKQIAKAGGVTEKTIRQILRVLQDNAFISWSKIDKDTCIKNGWYANSYRYTVHYYRGSELLNTIQAGRFSLKISLYPSKSKKNNPSDAKKHHKSAVDFLEEMDTKFATISENNSIEEDDEVPF
jgi:hypothetical protein